MMNNLKHVNKDFISDIDYHLSEIEIDLNRAKLDNNRNAILVWLFDHLLNRIKLLKKLII